MSLVHGSWTLHTSDPQDKVFALYGILNSAAGLGYRWVADYTRPVEDCYAQHTKRIMEETQNLRILSSVQDRSVRRIPTLPTRDPDYSLPGTNPLQFPFVLLLIFLTNPYSSQA